ncbi:hypothetical protein CRG98_036780 [Punica granatum]|uniref:Retrotransposon gag domain-containing protein n=1 Tax=Punica granatum TaxID=22663 RepID=A0A2I0IFR4_PUNGR|nr:hypothetical protein CRG98_036780 [Punica granatum]
MAEDQQPAISEQDTPPTPTHCQSPMAQALPPPTPVGISPTYSSTPLVQLPPLVAQTSSNFGDSARIAALEEIKIEIHSAFGAKSTVDPNLVVPSTLVSESEDASASAMAHVPVVYPVSDPLSPPSAPTVVPLPPAVFLTLDLAMHAPPIVAMPIQPSIYTVPQPMPSAPIQAAPTTPSRNFLPETENEQERRLKKMEETIKALQEGGSRFDYDDGDWNPFLGMRLSQKIKIPDFQRYDGTQDPRHHLRHYQSKMLQYYDYEEFVIQTFQDSLMRSALDWFMILKAADIPTWPDLSQKFLDQYSPAKQNLGFETSSAGTTGPSPADPARRQGASQAAATFNAANQNRTLRCEYHVDALGHKTDNCYALRGKLQEMIDENKLSFNEIRPSNVQANPLPDLGSSSGPTVNMISAYPIGED